MIVPLALFWTTVAKQKPTTDKNVNCIRTCRVAVRTSIADAPTLAASVDVDVTRAIGLAGVQTLKFFAPRGRVNEDPVNGCAHFLRLGSPPEIAHFHSPRREATATAERRSVG